jgi:oxygen-independent coproporphyrinogen-3 oxidase
MIASSGNPAPEETISLSEARFETVMLSLRMTAGINRNRFRGLHGAPPEAFYGDILRRLESQNLLILQDDSWRLTRRGMDIQNSILLEFMEDRD